MMFVVGRTPNSLDGLMVVGRSSFLNELIEIAGGQNIFSDASAGYVKVSLEEVLSRNPDVIVDMGDMSDTVAVTEAQKNSVTALWSRMNSISAVRARRVHAVASDIFVVPGPRVVDAVDDERAQRRAAAPRRRQVPPRILRRRFGYARQPAWLVGQLVVRSW